MHLHRRLLVRLRLLVAVVGLRCAGRLERRRHRPVPRPLRLELLPLPAARASQAVVSPRDCLPWRCRLPSQQPIMEAAAMLLLASLRLLLLRLLLR